MLLDFFFHEYSPYLIGTIHAEFTSRALKQTCKFLANKQFVIQKHNCLHEVCNQMYELEGIESCMPPFLLLSIIA